MATPSVAGFQFCRVARLYYSQCSVSKTMKITKRTTNPNFKFSMIKAKKPKNSQTKRFKKKPN